MKEGFYIRDCGKYGVVLYEYRYGILSYYNNHITYIENSRVHKHTVGYGWFLSKVKLDDKFIYLEDL